MEDFLGKPQKNFGLGFNTKTTKNPKKRTSCPAGVKESVWRLYNGNRMNGKCYVCKAPLQYTSFEVGHNKASAKGGKYTVNNLRPVCRACNRSMGTMSIEAYKKKYYKKPKPTKKSGRTRKPKIQTPYNPFGEVKPIKIKPISFGW